MIDDNLENLTLLETSLSINDFSNNEVISDLSSSVVTSSIINNKVSTIRRSKIKFYNENNIVLKEFNNSNADLSSVIFRYDGYSLYSNSNLSNVKSLYSLFSSYTTSFFNYDVSKLSINSDTLASLDFSSNVLIDNSANNLKSNVLNQSINLLSITIYSRP